MLGQFGELGFGVVALFFEFGDMTARRDPARRLPMTCPAAGKGAQRAQVSLGISTQHDAEHLAGERRVDAFGVEGVGRAPRRQVAFEFLCGGDDFGCRAQGPFLAGCGTAAEVADVRQVDEVGSCFVEWTEQGVHGIYKRLHCSQGQEYGALAVVLECRIICSAWSFDLRSVWGCGGEHLRMEEG